MLAVIFELEPHEGMTGRYLDEAGELRPLLQEIEGFVSIERFESLSQPGRVLSLSFWRDEEAIQQWRNLEAHRQAQKKGRKELFSHYRLRVAEVVRDYGMYARAEAPEDSKQAHTED
ncbi:antibiotic biosynthesis monooxygenase [Hahella sp. CCB-MM4]|uniref:antibiotic biosynthesis monooxygenase family protein n=1 Tax=Hahella sp. (strain CCB-MM4) TaxID=1926491 RepID=UPI000B9BA219|nr:antibiotic biosynthesis monooxygenase [Hahella sp. CCB-MM4]OZG71639.1 antibiotic biosynthesis monooxygenase [Hahella sp. CCB-MM4]